MEKHKTGGKKMLTMNEFKEAVTKDFKRFLDESFKDKEMVMYPLYKMNIANLLLHCIFDRIPRIKPIISFDSYVPSCTFSAVRITHQTCSILSYLFQISFFSAPFIIQAWILSESEDSLQTPLLFPALIPVS